MRAPLVALTVCLALFGIEEWVHARVREARAAAAVAAAKEFLAGLGPEQRKSACLDFDAEARSSWSFVPGARKGIALGDLDSRGLEAAHKLLSRLLSAQGYRKVAGIVELESTLREIERNPGRDPGRYWLAFYGEPGSAAWTVRFEGHHVSLNLSGQAGDWSGVTPLFLGVNPACVADGPKAGLRILRREEELARELYLGLDEQLRARATLTGALPTDVLLMPGKPVRFERPEGLSFAELPAESNKLAWQLVDEVLGDLAPEAAELARARLRATPADELRFAWSGGTKPGEPHYWRISGGENAFEFDNLPGGNHVHRLWRDGVRDLGGDALLEHYRAEHRR